MYITLFTDLPDLVILNVIRYLSPFDGIQAFYDIDNGTDRIVNLLIEAQCFQNIHQLRLPLFHFVCDHVLPRIGRKLYHLTLYDHQLLIARQKEILFYLSNLSSLHLIEILDQENILSYFLQPQIENLTIEFLSEHHIEVQAYICEQFIFKKYFSNLISCHLFNSYGLQLQHCHFLPNHSIERMTIQLKELGDLHVLFDHLSNIQILNVEICRWTMEEIKYDYQKLSKTLPNLIEFSLQTQHALSFNQLLRIIQNLIHLKKLSFHYRNYDERGIDINQLELTLNHLQHLIEFHFRIKFIYFILNPKLTFENCHQFKARWNVQTYHNSSYKSYFAYTKPLIDRNYSISSDFLLENDSIDYSSVMNLSLTTHTKQLSFYPIMYLLKKNFPSLTHLHIIDSFGIEENDQWNIKLPKLSSLNASDLKIPYLFSLLFRSIPNLIRLHINTNTLIHCDLKVLFRRNSIKYLELINNHFDQINDILSHFSHLEQLMIKSQKPSERKFVRSIYNWFEICPRLYIIHIQARKLSEIFYLTQLERNELMHVQYSSEMLTVWK